MHMGEDLTNVDVILTARPMSATATETQDAGVNVSPIVVTNFSTNC